MWIIRYSCQILMELAFSLQVLEKDSNIEFHDGLSMGAELLHADRQTDRHDGTNSHFSQSYERA